MRLIHGPGLATPGAFGMFENDQNKNERKDAFHYKT